MKTNEDLLLTLVTEIQIPAKSEVFSASEYFSVSKYPDRYCCEQEVSIKFLHVSEMFKHYFGGLVEEGAEAHTLRCYRLNRMCWNERPILEAFGVMEECGDMEPFARDGGTVVTRLSAIRHLIDLSWDEGGNDKKEKNGGVCFVKDRIGRTRIVSFGWTKDDWGYWRETTKHLFVNGFSVGSSCLDNSCGGPIYPGCRYWIKV